MGSYISKDVQCPYYHEVEPQKIKCEGVDIDDQSTIHLAFGSKTKLRHYMETFCCSDYKKCRLVQMNDRKWEEDT